MSVQNADGGWAANKSIKSSIEESALAVNALAEILTISAVKSGNKNETYPLFEQIHLSALKGCWWLVKKAEDVKSLTPSPIGLYFARLWYSEELYPVIFTLSTLTKIQKIISISPLQFSSTTTPL